MFLVIYIKYSCCIYTLREASLAVVSLASSALSCCAWLGSMMSIHAALSVGHHVLGLHEVRLADEVRVGSGEARLSHAVERGGVSASVVFAFSRGS